MVKIIIINWLIISATILANPAWAADPLGRKPGYNDGNISSVPNQQAITRQIWAPGLEEGYVPQGLTYHQGLVYISGYMSTNPKVGKGPCRVFSVSSKDGSLQGYFDLPDDCGHAGGLVVIDPETIIVSDTKKLYKINLARALEEKSSKNSVISTVNLGGALKGSFVDFDGKDIWIGSSEKTEDKARAYRLSLSIFDGSTQHKLVKENHALTSIPIPVSANGMAFDSSGNMWIACSNSRFGALYKINPNSGELYYKSEMVIGIEDLGFDPGGKLWSVSEAGSRRWSKWSKFYPVIFQVDTSLLAKENK